jgi:spermidine export protein MdtJ
MLKARFFLLVAVFFEIVGILIMKKAASDHSLGLYLLMYPFFVAAYVSLSFAMRKIAVGIAFAIWEGIGVTTITLISFFVLHEDISQQELIGLAMAIIGIILLNFGSDDEPKMQEAQK